MEDIRSEGEDSSIFFQKDLDSFEGGGFGSLNMGLLKEKLQTFKDSHEGLAGSNLVMFLNSYSGIYSAGWAISS